MHWQNTSWTMLYFKIHGSTVLIWIICHFIATTFALFPSSSTNWRGYAFFSHWSNQFLYWCLNNILKMKCSMKVCFDQASLTRKILCRYAFRHDKSMTDDAILTQFRNMGGRALCGLSLQAFPSLLSSPVPPFHFSLPASPAPPLTLCACYAGYDVMWCCLLRCNVIRRVFQSHPALSCVFESGKVGGGGGVGDRRQIQ